MEDDICSQFSEAIYVISGDYLHTDDMDYLALPAASSLPWIACKYYV